MIIAVEKVLKTKQREQKKKNTLAPPGSCTPSLLPSPITLSSLEMLDFSLTQFPLLPQ